jgi:hypothetical protein
MLVDHNFANAWSLCQLIHFVECAIWLLAGIMHLSQDVRLLPETL